MCFIIEVHFGISNNLIKVILETIEFVQRVRMFIEEKAGFRRIFRFAWGIKSISVRFLRTSGKLPSEPVYERAMGFLPEAHVGSRL